MDVKQAADFLAWRFISASRTIGGRAGWSPGLRFPFGYAVSNSGREQDEQVRRQASYLTSASLSPAASYQDRNTPQPLG